MPANAVGQAKLMAQADRIRGQARSYSRSAATARSWASATPVCGERKGAGTRKTCRSVACPAIGCEAVVNLTTPCLLTHRIHCIAAAARQIAGQATLPQWICVDSQTLWWCGSRLAAERKGAGTRKTCRSVACPAIGCEAVVNLTTPCLLTHRIHCVAAAARQIAGQATLLQ